MKTQREWLKKALELSQEHPDLEIHFCVSEDEILDEITWTAHNISNVEIGYWYQDDEGVYTTDLSDIQDSFCMNSCPEITINNQCYKCKDLIDFKETIEEAILIYTEAEV